MGDMAEYYDDRTEWDDEIAEDRRLWRKLFGKKKTTKNHGDKKPVRGKMIDRVCQCGCGQTFKAREADVKRGWGKFSSKACAAIYKDRISGGRNREHYGY